MHAILIANRGEIACRIIRTAKRLGIRTVVVYSSADMNARHVFEGDQAYFIGESPSQLSYLNQEAILSVAKQAKVTAIHPGYGFLSENPEFAEACQQAGFIFIGPPSRVIRIMGDKALAKKTMVDAGIAVIPGVCITDEQPQILLEQAEKLGYPLLIKAVAGGGGRGMRLVQAASELLSAIDSAKQEAWSSFGDSRFFLESYLPNARHIEVQVFSDQHGHCVHLFERNCSIQRRHQKIIEESPAYHLSEQQKQILWEGAKQAAQAVGYVGAGTVEYLVDKRGIYFMEMNTRLQVEHPVTEYLTGIDLVEWQWRIAMGESLPLTQEQIKRQGHAIELRIIAEDPERGFLPCLGHVNYFEKPEDGKNLRLDLGIQQGNDISPYYDGLLGKMIGFGQSRQEAMAELKQALKQWRLFGVETNVNYLSVLLNHPVFLQGDYTTRFITEHHSDLLITLATYHRFFIHFALIFFLNNPFKEKASSLFSPWQKYDAWRLNGQGSYQFFLVIKDHPPMKVKVIGYAHHYSVEYDQYRICLMGDCIDNQRIKLTEKNQSYWAHYLGKKDKVTLFYQGQTCTVSCLDNPILAHDISSEAHFHAGSSSLYSHSEGSLKASIPGVIRDIAVQVGQSVVQGQRLLSMEAMKMEHTVLAPEDGQISAIPFQVGDQIKENDVLIIFEQN